MDTSKPEIAKYWAEHAPYDVFADWADAERLCWRCKYDRRLERCHIVPDSMGGNDEPANLVLLCNQCHREAPNHKNPYYMWIWLRETAGIFEGVYWTMRALAMFEQMFGRAPGGYGSGIRDIETAATFNDRLLEIVSDAAIHWGDGYPNPATLACLIAEAEKSLADGHA